MKELLKEGKRLLSTLLAVIICFFLFCAIFPQHVSALSNMISDLSQAQFVNINIGDININLNNQFELPKLDFDINEIAMPTLNVSIFLIIGVVLLIILSSVSPIISISTTLIFTIVCIPVVAQTMDAYKSLISSGSTSWQASGACFGSIFLILLVVASNGLLGLSGTIAKFFTDNFILHIILSIILTLIVGAIISVIAAGICCLILGLGWAGGIILMFIIMILFSMFVELINCFAH